jgi:hypothetical protein
MLAGIQDFYALKLSAALVVVSSMLAWIAERDNVGAARPKWLAFTLSVLAGIAALIPLIGTFIGTTLFGEERFSWYVYAIAFVLLLGSLAYTLRLYRQLKSGTTADDYPRVESGYMRIDLLTKFAVVLLVLIALK